MKSYWKSIYTGVIYEMPIDWTPDYGGWEAVTEAEYKESMAK